MWQSLWLGKETWQTALSNKQLSFIPLAWKRQLKEIVLCKQRFTLTLITFIRANPETPYHPVRPWLISPCSFHLLSRHHEVENTHMRTGMLMCDAQLKKKVPQHSFPSVRNILTWKQDHSLHPRFSFFSLIQMHGASLNLPPRAHSS